LIHIQDQFPSLKNRTFNKQIGHKKERHGALD